MHVIATAGHVDHGKSALIRALTGMEPDRWEEERRRGMTIDLGYAWGTLPSGEEVAYVDVPGHERFTSNMLAGVGPVPAALVVVAADGGWSAQTVEHVAALDALGVAHGVLAVTRADLADPGPVLADARARLAATSLGNVEAVATSVVTGAGLDDLRAALGRLVGRLPAPAVGGRVRLWVDRAFTVNGFGTVVTGTLGSGTVSVEDDYDLDGERVAVRGVESLGRPAPAVPAVARVAVNLRSVPGRAPQRGQVLLTPGAWSRTAEVDGRLLAPVETLPRSLMVHVGSAAVPVRPRRLGGDLVRLALHRTLPLQVGDRLLLRDPGRRRLVGGLVVLDPDPPPLAARGAGAARARELAATTGVPDPADEVRRRGWAESGHLARLGVPVDPCAAPSGVIRVGAWLVGDERWAAARRDLDALVDAPPAPGQRVDAGVARDDAVRRLGLPSPDLLAPLLDACPGVELTGGRLRRRDRGPTLAPRIAAALAPLLAAMQAAPFAAPPAGDVAAAALSARDLAAAAASGAAVVLPGGVLLPPDAVRRAAAVLDGLGPTFTVSEAREALGTSRRVAVPLLEHLDRAGLTRRVDGDRRERTARRP